MDKEVDVVNQSEYVDKFNQYMQDDLNTAMVLSLIESIIKDINKNISSNQEIEILVGSLIHILNTLGFTKDIFNYQISDDDKQLYVK
ncbi:hypothetical protein JIY74_29645 [Vibrio harveyi]|nr:hypothetical protein [Vibrio harveyi]